MRRPVKKKKDPNAKKKKLPENILSSNNGTDLTFFEGTKTTAIASRVVNRPTDPMVRRVKLPKRPGGRNGAFLSLVTIRIAAKI